MTPPSAMTSVKLTTVPRAVHAKLDLMDTATRATFPISVVDMAILLAEIQDFLAATQMPDICQLGLDKSSQCRV